MEDGKKPLSGNITRETTSNEQANLREYNPRLKEVFTNFNLLYEFVKTTLDILD
jgi:hypothetical protein